MKKFTALTLLVGVFMFLSCEGPSGSPGPAGEDGEIIVSGAFEIEENFTATNNYRFTENYGFNVYPFDVTLVYMLWETDNGQDVWRPLPQTVIFDDDTTLIYNFDFTQTDVSIFMEGTVDFNTLETSYTQNQVFRVVVVPAENVDAINTNDFDVVSKTLNISSFTIK
ncbi:MAG: hypothetical protein ACK5MZ_01235 [Aestuariibaculum sp.]